MTERRAVRPAGRLYDFDTTSSNPIYSTWQLFEGVKGVKGVADPSYTLYTHFSSYLLYKDLETTLTT